MYKRHVSNTEFETTFLNLEENIKDFDKINISHNASIYNNNPESLFYTVDENIKSTKRWRDFLDSNFILIIYFLIILFILVIYMF